MSPYPLGKPPRTQTVCSTMVKRQLYRTCVAVPQADNADTGANHVPFVEQDRPMVNTFCFSTSKCHPIRLVPVLHERTNRLDISPRIHSLPRKPYQSESAAHQAASTCPDSTIMGSGSQGFVGSSASFNLAEFMPNSRSGRGARSELPSEARSRYLELDTFVRVCAAGGHGPAAHGSIRFHCPPRGSRR